MIKDNDFIHLPELYLTLESLKKHIKQHYNLNITNMANENKHSGYNDEQMAMTQLDIIHRYSVKLETMISEGAYLEEWVKMKLSRVELMIASVKHALEGIEKFEDGGELARQQLLHISKYSAKLIEMLKEGSVLMSWMESNIAICADYMDGVYHHLDYKMGNRAKQMEYKDGGGVGRTHTLLEKRISSIGDQSTKAGRKDRFNVVVGYINEAYDNKEISKAEAIDFYKQAVEETDYLNEDKAFESKFNVTEYNNGGGVDMAEKGKRIYTDWNGKKNNENWGKYNLYDKYNNILDLCADLVDFLRKTKEQLGEDYYISAKRDLLSAINNESIGYFDNGVLKFKAGGGIPNMYGGKTAEQVWDSWTESQRKHFCYDHELMDNVSWKTLKMSSEQLKRDNWGKEFGGRTSWDWIKNVLQEHIEEGQYKNGGGIDMANKFPTTKDGWEKFMDEKFAEFKKVETEYMAKYNPHWNYKYEAGFWRADKDGKPVEITLKEGGSRFPYTLDGFLRHIEELKSKIEYRNGGGVDSYGDMNPEQVWNNWSSSQRYHFIYDHMKESTPITQEELSKKAYSFLPANVKQELHEHIHMGKYNAGGGVEEMREIEYADGGTIGTGKNAKALMRMDNDIWDKLNIDSGSQLYSDEKLQKKYAEELTKGLEKMGFETYTLKAGDILTDWNYHALRSAMTFMGYFGETEKNNQLEYKRETKKLGLSYYGLTPEIFTK